MKVVILCGGQGTRLREETEFRPKPLVHVGERPILWHIMKLFRHAQFCDFVLCLGYRGRMIKEYFLNWEALNYDFTMCFNQQHNIQYHGAEREPDFRVTLADTGEETMTGGRLLRVRKYLNQEPFMVTYGDGLSDIDLPALLEFHTAHGKLATLSTIQPNSRFGILDLDADGRVRQFREKPRTDSWANVGFMVFNPGVFAYLDGDDCVLEQEPLERLAEDGQLMAYRHDGFFFAMDTYREFRQLNDIWQSGKAPWKVWE